jgi:hypothetical protein
MTIKEIKEDQSYKFKNTHNEKVNEDNEDSELKKIIITKINQTTFKTLRISPIIKSKTLFEIIESPTIVNSTYGR